jgi:hypothetical protein
MRTAVMRNLAAGGGRRTAQHGIETKHGANGGAKGDQDKSHGASSKRRTAPFAPPAPQISIVVFDRLHSQSIKAADSDCPRSQEAAAEAA